MTRRADIAARLPMPIGYRIPDAAAAIGVSEPHFRTMIERGTMPRPRDVNGVPVIAVTELLNAFSALPYQSSPTGPGQAAPDEDVVM